VCTNTRQVHRIFFVLDSRIGNDLDFDVSRGQFLKALGRNLDSNLTLPRYIPIARRESFPKARLKNWPQETVLIS
jgi:hypothetical protein